MKKVCCQTEILMICFCFILNLFTSSLPRRKDQFGVSYFATDKFNCTDPGLPLGDPAPFIGLLLWTCRHFIYTVYVFLLTV